MEFDFCAAPRYDATGKNDELVGGSGNDTLDLSDTFTESHAWARMETDSLAGIGGCIVGAFSGNPFVAMGTAGVAAAANDFFVGQAHLPYESDPEDFNEFTAKNLGRLASVGVAKWGLMSEGVRDGTLHLRYPNRSIVERASSALLVGTVFGLSCAEVLLHGLSPQTNALELGGSFVVFSSDGVRQLEQLDKQAGLAPERPDPRPSAPAAK